MTFLTKEGVTRTIDAMPTTGLLVAPFVAPIAPDFCTLYSDITFSPVTGFHPQSLIFNTPFVVACEAKITSIPVVFAATALTGLPATIYGWAYYWDLSPSPNQLFCIELLDSPEVISQIGDGFTAQLCLELAACKANSCK